MSQISDGNYYVVSGWMINKLNLSNTELMVFAIIYGFCQHDEFNGSYHGSLQYLADFTGTTKQTIIKVLKSLVEKDYIEKSESYQNNVKFCAYKINTTVVNNLTGSKKSLMGSKESLTGGGKKSLIGGSKESLPNNECSDNKSFDNKDIFNVQEVVDLFNSICVSLNKVKNLTDTRKKKIKSAYKLLNGDYEGLFKRVEESDFLSGRSGKWDKCGFDWIMKQENMVKILEGNYDNKGGNNNGGTQQDSKEESSTVWGGIDFSGIYI